MIKFTSFSSEDFAEYTQRAVRGYAEEKVRAGNWEAETALRQAEQEFKTLLPYGLETNENYFCWILANIESGEHKVGNIWYASSQSNRDDIFIWDFEIFEDFRRRGYASEALVALEEKCRELGKHSISLHVFGDNRAARKLYEKVGFKETNVMMTKKLS